MSSPAETPPLFVIKKTKLNTERTYQASKFSKDNPFHLNDFKRLAALQKRLVPIPPHALPLPVWINLECIENSDERTKPAVGRFILRVKTFDQRKEAVHRTGSYSLEEGKIQWLISIGNEQLLIVEHQTYYY